MVGKTARSAIHRPTSDVALSVTASSLGREARTDEALLSAMALGSEEAGVAFVRRYQGRVFGLAFSILRERAVAEEVAQEALFRAWRHATVFDTRKGSASSWLLTITRNLAVDALRLRRPVAIDPEGLALLELASTDDLPDEMAEKAEDRRAVRSALAELPESQRRALYFAVFYGLTAREVAERECIPLGTAKTRIRNGLEKLRRSMTAGTRETSESEWRDA